MHELLLLASNDVTINSSLFAGIIVVVLGGVISFSAYMMKQIVNMRAEQTSTADALTRAIRAIDALEKRVNQAEVRVAEVKATQEFLHPSKKRLW